MKGKADMIKKKQLRVPNHPHLNILFQFRRRKAKIFLQRDESESFMMRIRTIEFLIEAKFNSKRKNFSLICGGGTSSLSPGANPIKRI